MFVDEEEQEDADRNKENEDGIYNYEEKMNEQDVYNGVGSYKESPTTMPRRRLQNPQHVKLMVNKC